MTQLFSKLFELRDTLHLTHLYQKDKKLATHLALGDAYEGILGFTDELIECWSALYGTPEIMIPSTTKADNPLTFIQSAYQAIENNRKGISESFLQNIIDEIQAVLARTIYKLKYVNE